MENVAYRLTITQEKPISRTYWFTSVFTRGSQSVRSLMVTHLIQENIRYIDVLGVLWFQYNGAWCAYDYEVQGNAVKFFLLEYIQN